MNQAFDAAHEPSRLAFQNSLDAIPIGGSLSLKSIEYPGPVSIRHSLTIDGKGATAWALAGPLITIRSGAKVTLRELRVEVTGEQLPGEVEQECAILVEPGGELHLDRVEVRGAVVGLHETGVWRYPKSLHLGQVQAGVEHVFILRIVVAAACQITSEVCGLEVEPRRLAPGSHEIQLRLEKLKNDVLLQGRLLFDTGTLRRWMLVHALSMNRPECSLIPSSNVAWEPSDWGAFAAVTPSPAQPLTSSPSAAPIDTTVPHSAASTTTVAGVPALPPPVAKQTPSAAPTPKPPTPKPPTPKSTSPKPTSPKPLSPKPPLPKPPSLKPPLKTHPPVPAQLPQTHQTSAPVSPNVIREPLGGAFRSSASGPDNASATNQPSLVHTPSLDQKHKQPIADPIANAPVENQREEGVKLKPLSKLFGPALPHVATAPELTPGEPIKTTVGKDTEPSPTPSPTVADATTSVKFKPLSRLFVMPTKSTDPPDGNSGTA
jgi:hypothetical protein